MTMWAELYGTGQKAAVGGLTDAALLAKMSRYKRTVAKSYRMLFQEDLARVLPKGKLWISTKLDGELWFMVKRGSNIALCATNGRVLTEISICREAQKSLPEEGDLIIAGELYALPREGRPRVQHVARALSDPTLAATLRFAAFDIVEDGAEDALLWPYERTITRLKQLISDGETLSVVTTVQGEASDAISYYREWVAAEKFEGLVIRSEQGITFKTKPTFTLDAVVVAFGERMTGEVVQVREMALGLRLEDGSLQLIGTVGGGFSEEDRVAWHKRLAPMVVPSSFRMANREGTLCRFVKPEIVVEIKCSDLLEADADDSPIRRMTLSYTEGSGYAAVADRRVAALLFPVFLRERPDKQPTVADIGLTQMTSRLSADFESSRGVAASYKPSQVLRRAAWVKGETAVRKYVVIETHKQETQDYAPYVVYFTDYSAGRAEPLKTSLRTASTIAQTEALVTAWIEENVKRGWVEAGAAAAAKTATASAAASGTSDATPGAGEAAAAKPKARKSSKRATKTDVAADAGSTGAADVATTAAPHASVGSGPAEPAAGTAAADGTAASPTDAGNGAAVVTQPRKRSRAKKTE